MDAAMIVVLSLMVSGVVAYFLLLFYFPEWIGVTGNEAKKAIGEHEEGSESKDSDIF